MASIIRPPREHYQDLGHARPENKQRAKKKRKNKKIDIEVDEN